MASIELFIVFRKVHNMQSQMNREVYSSDMFGEPDIFAGSIESQYILSLMNTQPNQ